MSTLQFYLGVFKDDFSLKKFRTLVMQTRPVEYICLSSLVEGKNAKNEESLKILRNSPCPPALTMISFRDATSKVD